MNDRIKTLHPEAKEGVNILRSKYDRIKETILDLVNEQGEITFGELTRLAKKRLKNFDGSVSWYVVTVKLDLEARGMLERIPKSRPQRLRLKERK